MKTMENTTNVTNFGEKVGFAEMPIYVINNRTGKKYVIEVCCYDGATPKEAFEDTVNDKFEGLYTYGGVCVRGTEKAKMDSMYEVFFEKAGEGLMVIDEVFCFAGVSPKETFEAMVSKAGLSSKEYTFVTANFLFVD